MNLKKILNQTAVYWPPALDTGFGGKTYDEPYEVDVRWTDGQEKFIGNNAEEYISKAYILAESDFEINGRLYLGTLIDLGSGQDPDENEALLIKGYAKIPDKTASQFLRKAWLV